MASNSIETEIEFFSRKELACRGTGIILLDPDFAFELSYLRETWDKPLNPTSVCRTPEYNKKIGGHPNSLHLTDNRKWSTEGTAAADIWWDLWPTGEKVEFVELAWDHGWSIGLHPNFVHIDRRSDFRGVQSVFKYPNWTEDLPYDLL